MTSNPRLYLSPPDVGPRERELLLEAFDSGYVAPTGPMLDAFERAFAQYVDLPHAVAVASGTAALHLALHVMGVGRGDAVIAPSFTFMGGVSPIVHRGAQPIFVDCDSENWGLDPVLLDEAFRAACSAGLDPKVVIPCDLYGQACDIDAIREVAERHGAHVILDSAEGVGALYKGRPAGHGAAAAAYSFNGNKILTTSGGGMLCSEDKALIDRVRYLATAARQPVSHYEHTEVGYNFRLSNITAGIGLGQLEGIESKVARRREIFESYRQRLGNLAGLSFQTEGPERRHTRWLSIMLIDAAAFGANPETLRLELEKENIESRRLWKPMHLQPVFRDAVMIGGARCEDLFARGLCLPSGSGMSENDVDRVCDAVTAAAGTLRPAMAGQ